MPDSEHSNRSLSERLIVVETKLDELPRVRERVHDLVQCTQQLVSTAEDAADSRKRISDKIDLLGSKVEATALASARAEVSLGATVAAHIEQCKTDKAEDRASAAMAHAMQQRMHEENKDNLDGLQSRLIRLEVRMAGYAGGAVVLTWLVTHGLSWAEKFIK